MTKDTELEEINLPNMANAVNQMTQQLGQAIQGLSDEIEEVNEALEGPIMENELNEIENNLSNVITDEELEEILERLHVIRSINSEESDVGLNYEGEPHGETKMYLEMIDGADIIDFNRHKGVQPSHNRITLEVVPQDEL